MYQIYDIVLKQCRISVTFLYVYFPQIDEPVR